jgi:hypothetical protein
MNADKAIQSAFIGVQPGFRVLLQPTSSLLSDPAGHRLKPLQAEARATFGTEY